MIFTSVDFFYFVIIVMPAYFLTVKFKNVNNLIILVASYTFYGWLEWRLVFLLLASSLIDFICGLRVQSVSGGSARHQWVVVSVISNLSILGFFKYANFFIGTVASSLSAIGIDHSYVVLNVILPAGISFYTFQSMSYTIDVYRRELAPTGNVLDYLCYVSFFPQLVAGPIERAGHLLPQTASGRRLSISKIRSGLALILVGFLKKTVGADQLATAVDPVYAAPQSQDTFVLCVATLGFAFQIYLDFSAYTDIARGIARVMGFDIMQNFRRPYLAASLQEFWSRWHISLSTFFRDYVYIPLGGSHRGLPVYMRNIALVFLLSGLWHGAAWTFVIWGAVHGAGLILEQLRKKFLPTFLAPAMGFGSWGLTFVLVLLAWVLFRAESLGDAAYIYGRLFDLRGWTQVTWALVESHAWILLLCGAVLALDFVMERCETVFAGISRNAYAAWAVSVAGLLAIFWLGRASDVAFIYFQF